MRHEADISHQFISIAHEIEMEIIAHYPRWVSSPGERIHVRDLSFRLLRVGELYMFIKVSSRPDGLCFCAPERIGEEDVAYKSDGAVAQWCDAIVQSRSGGLDRALEVGWRMGKLWKPLEYLLIGRF